MNIGQGEQFNELGREAALASLRYYEEVLQLDVRKLMAGDETEWQKTRLYPPAFIMQLEELMCRANGENQMYP